MTTALVFLTFILLYLFFVWKAGKTFPILQIFLFIYFLQYIFSSYLIYNEYEGLRSQMPIEPEQYFSYVIPACLFLFGGVFLFDKELDLRASMEKIDPKQAARLGYLLLVISYVFDFAPQPQLASIHSFTSYMKYIAAFCLLFTNSRLNYILIGAIFLNLLYIALYIGLFIDFFIWATYLFFFISLKFKFSFALRSLFIVGAMPVLLVIQSVKGEYRQETWVGKREAGLNVYVDLLEKRNQEVSDQPFSQSEGVVNTVSRLSQGWHLGLVLRRVPEREPFSDGEDMTEDVVGSILPRLFFPEKKIIGSQEKFLKYTGHRLHGRTSMTIGILGDFYVNYGWWGSLFMLFIFGALIARLLYFFIRRFVIPDPINIVWVPFMLSYLVRANNDFYIVFNCLVKGFLIFLFVNFVRKQLWPSRRLRTITA